MRHLILCVLFALAASADWNTPNPDGVNYCVRDFDRSYFDQDSDLHNGVIAPAATAGAHTRQAEPRFQAGGIALAEKSPGHDDAVRLTNFNDDFRGAQPDRGAQESGAPALEFGAVLWHKSRAR